MAMHLIQSMIKLNRKYLQSYYLSTLSALATKIAHFHSEI